MPSIGYAYAVLKGKATGDKEKAKKFIEGLSLGEKTARNRSESRVRGKLRKRGYRPGDRRGRR